MMGGVSPETCWASFKYGIINFDKVLHLVGYFYMNYTIMHGSTNIKLIYLFMLFYIMVKNNCKHTHSLVIFLRYSGSRSKSDMVSHHFYFSFVWDVRGHTHHTQTHTTHHTHTFKHTHTFTYSHTYTRTHPHTLTHTHPVGLLCVSDKLVADAASSVTHDK